MCFVYVACFGEIMRLICVIDDQLYRVQRNYWPRCAASLFVLFLCFSLTGCATTPPPPKNQQNVCSIFKQYPDWYKAAKKSEKKWGVPVNVQMAIMKRESDFYADARPPRRKFLWIFPSWKRVTSAYGYSQALDGTWDWYKNANNKYWVSRDDFADAIDFVGWYNHQSVKRLNVEPSDAYSLYLAYHEGMWGFKRKSYEKKLWLKRVAKQVQKRSQNYGKQLSICKPAKLPTQSKRSMG